MMAKQDPDRKSLKDLMKSGAGLTGFPWPETYVDFDIRILRDGTWTYRGDPIRRLKLCQLFATVLQKDDAGDFWLVTPVEKGRIEVEDAPFVAVEMTAEESTAGGAKLSFRTNLDYWVTAGKGHAIRVTVDPETQEPSPYIEVRDGMDALISRAVFYDMVDRAVEDIGPDGPELFLESDGCRFSLGRL